MITISVDDIERDLQSFLQLLEAGNVLVVMQGDRPIAEINPIQSKFPVKQLRPFGLCAGQFVVLNDFNDPLPDDIINEFESL
ncbi:type II toxin-antitoxin system Phd/YefM family antitoxin [Kamptonema sp. UHCC 0994]|uniref:type II toxin-antitoxin system Phd/YefM family antitoxin n=1 Tax=Kamptonema sp. UHCC 0994 TaxID=3031329 RepID=UPI0023B8EA30|nr:type II toxin-antitoxin system Phd/YefM family antitoxin [Kamptonema sp. UHCC 0994]MDF0552140.1 type II toxin-antitoxin system Phd/YefM family antitoxin [Kamptonema sp. UHCC 0994]